MGRISAKVFNLFLQGFVIFIAEVFHCLSYVLVLVSFLVGLFCSICGFCEREYFNVIFLSRFNIGVYEDNLFFMFILYIAIS
jgi:hypothetical protein